MNQVEGDISLVMLHGALASKEQFHDFRIINDKQQILCPDFSGHGEFAHSAEKWSVNLFRDQVNTICASVMKPVSLFGYSMGGYVALAAGLSKPSQYKSIITLGTKLRWSAETAEKSAMKMNPEAILNKVPAYAKHLQELHGKDHWKEVLLKTAGFIRSLGNDPYLLPDMMKEMKVPVLYIVGDRDEMVSIEETCEYHRSTPGSQLLILPGTSHSFEKVDKGPLLFHMENFLNFSDC